MVKNSTGAQAVLWNPILSTWNLKAMTLAMFQQIRIVEGFDVSEKLGSKTHGTTAVGFAAANTASSWPMFLMSSQFKHGKFMEIYGNLEIFHSKQVSSSDTM